jgi:hypothetical protein
VTPLVSVITATYNRSAVLALALDTARRQTVADYELIVVGDACTDDTEQVVTGLGDPRVRWVNRALNAGEQSVANNAGTALARGRYVAFLNHDDLWWPDHLERLLATLEGERADLAFAFGIALLADGTPVATPASASGAYEPHLFVPASGWLARRELIDRVGPWRPAARLLVAPSADWIFRAHRSGARLRQSPELTVLMLPSGLRPGSYAEHAGPAEHSEWHARLAAAPERLRAELAAAAALESAAQAARPHTLRENLTRTARDLVRRAAIGAGATPMHLGYLVRYRRRGGFMAELRRRRGLERR